MKRCSKKTEWGRCQQPAIERLCSAHQHWADQNVTPDRSYHEKIAKGLTQPTWDYLSDSEANAVLNGRYRGDGRRVDQFVSGDPLLIDQEAFGA